MRWSAGSYYSACSQGILVVLHIIKNALVGHSYLPKVFKKNSVHEKLGPLVTWGPCAVEHAAHVSHTGLIVEV